LNVGRAAAVTNKIKARKDKRIVTPVQQQPQRQRTTTYSSQAVYFLSQGYGIEEVVERKSSHSCPVIYNVCSKRECPAPKVCTLN
jgi:hypothetical protein